VDNVFCVYEVYIFNAILQHFYLCANSRYLINIFSKLYLRIYLWHTCLAFSLHN